MMPRRKCHLRYLLCPLVISNCLKVKISLHHTTPVIVPKALLLQSYLCWYMYRDIPKGPQKVLCCATHTVFTAECCCPVQEDYLCLAGKIPLLHYRVSWKNSCNNSFVPSQYAPLRTINDNLQRRIKSILCHVLCNELLPLSLQGNIFCRKKCVEDFLFLV